MPPRLFLREWRLHRGWSLNDMAERSGITKGNLSLYERPAPGRRYPGGGTLERFAKALRVRVPELYAAPPKQESDPTPQKARGARRRSTR